MRKALIAGIDYYKHIAPLHGCVSDAHSVRGALERHSDGTVNFGIKLLTGTGPNEIVSRSVLREDIKDLFAGDSETALFYFAGHGYIETTGGYILTSDCQTGHDGIALGDIVTLANQSRARNKIIVLDSCHSGVAGAHPSAPQNSELSDGLTILTASTDEQYASENNSGGVFTGLFVDALSGAAANLVGDITPGSVYAHIDQSLGPWEQRPVFKTNVKSFVSLRKVQAPIPLPDLQRICEFFPSAGFEFRLDPSFEPERGTETPKDIPPPKPENTQKFAILQRYARVNLVVPVGAPHMWHAAMESRFCKLTVLGEHYRRLVAKKMI